MIVVNARFLTQKITGVQRFAIEISKILRTLNNNIVFVTHRGILDPQLAKALGAIVIGKNKGAIWEQVDLRAYLIFNQKPLLVNFCNTGLLFYKYQIVTIHDMSYKVNPKWFSKKFYLWYNFLIPRIAENSSKIFTVSNASKYDIIRYLKLKEEKISVIYNSCYLNTNDNFDRLNDGRYILSVSTFDPRKNLNTLISAFNKTDRSVKLIIVGLESSHFDFELNKELLNDNIIIKGYVDDLTLMSLMKNAEAFISLSLYEGFGLPAIEAMSAGCPVIVSDIPAHKEVCGNAAIYANPYDVDDVKKQLELVLNNHELKQELIIASKENLKRFNWFNSANKVLKNINETIEKYK
jgi:glycosyltransferase involved in cell wall biosynthesis